MSIASRMTKIDYFKKYCEMTGKTHLEAYHKETLSFTFLNRFLFDCVLNGIVPFEKLTLQEGKSLIRILEGKNKSWKYSKKLGRIVER